MKMKAVMNWSGGKDSSLALFDVMRRGEVEVVSLLTTLNETHGRVSMHGVREALLDEQAAAIGLPLVKVKLSDEPTMAAYERGMNEAMMGLRAQGVGVSIFGDIFLEDLRAYREQKLRSAGFEGLFPLWKLDTKMLAGRFVEQGFKGVTSCVSDEAMGEAWVGREMDAGFFAELPEGVDACGEHGEFHSFVYDGPHMKKGVRIEIGEKVYREYHKPEGEGDDDSLCGGRDEEPSKMGFWYCDLIAV
ncbi:ATP-binding region [Poriferisphaera corsica]|uniref:ATP-binding region n=1 Tax=Poriferisphaera corsica TaxID=2528020 RepID=A0A517YZE7_9BACT|nr:adenine nucleotide alpha hydrolase [Poriferisphaera corsica]QDU35595.1 ATP-binding region [Poriferisphaera corsica]